MYLKLLVVMSLIILMANYTIICLMLVMAFVLFLLSMKTYTYWSSRGVKQRKQNIPLLGDSARVLFQAETFWDLIQKLYNAFPEERYMGMYQMTTPTLLLRDPELIKQIMVKDFDYFSDHRSLIPEGVDELWAKNLISLKGDRWRDMRSTMSPIFTTSKMKMIFNLISECAQEFNKYFVDLASKDVVPVELKEECTRYTTDVIATVVFGIKTDSLRERENEFYMMGQATTLTGFWQSLKFFLFTSAPIILKLLNITLFPKDLGDFFKRIVKETIVAREERGIIRHDLLQLLIEAKKERQKHDEDDKMVGGGFTTVEEVASSTKIAKQEITDIDITAQALVFFFGGFESVSTLMCFMGHELAVNPDVQRKLQEEIDETMEDCKGNLTYEALVKMKYLDMIISESLRKWPVSVFTDRVCTKPFTISALTNEEPLELQKGDQICIPIVGLHYDPYYFPDPERFDPERFSEENKNNIKPYTYLPFGVGPRNCIGSRFALIEIKTIFSYLLSKFDLVVIEKTQIPLKLSTKKLNMASERGFWVGLKLRNVV